jgi:hypothetical protein
MISSPEKSSSSDLSGPQGRAKSSGEPPLFTNLLASAPPRERRFAPWAIAGLLHVVAIALLLFTDVGHSVRDAMVEVVRPILLEDNPPAIIAPIPPPPPVTQVQPEQVAPPGAPTRELVTPVAPGLPDPAVITVPRAAEPTAPPTGVPGGTGTLRDALSTGVPKDPRLFAPVDGLAPLIGVEAVRARLSLSIKEINDSIMAERIAARKANDWTRTDGSGNRWGVSRDPDKPNSGKLHLGPITIPLFGSEIPYTDEARSQLRSYAEMKQAVEREEIRDNFNDRIKAIRKRKDAEREALKKRPVTN